MKRVSIAKTYKFWSNGPIMYRDVCMNHILITSFKSNYSLIRQKSTGRNFSGNLPLGCDHGLGYEPNMNRI